MLQQAKQNKRMPITVVRPFQMVNRDPESGAVSGHKVLKKGDVLTVDEVFGREMIAVGKAAEGEVAVAAEKAKADK